MKKIFFLFFYFIHASALSQTQYQIGIGAGLSFLQLVDMTTGTVGLKFKPDKNVLIDYNRTINKKNNISLGAQARMNFSSYWYEPNKAISYYSEREHDPLFEFESIELSFYLKKYFRILRGGNNSIHLFVNLGPGFNINEGNFNGNRTGVRDDNSQYFQISRNKHRAQKLFIPYLIVTGGLEIHKRFQKKYYLGISPFITWIGLQSENNDLTVLKDDPANISTGEFKRNRSGYGVRLIFSK